MSMTEETKEYVTFMISDKEGNEVELAVVDEFEFEHKNYVAAAKIEGDTISLEGIYIYRVRAGEEFAVEKITNQIDYQKIAEAYMEMENEG